MYKSPSSNVDIGEAKHKKIGPITRRIIGSILLVFSIPFYYYLWRDTFLLAERNIALSIAYCFVPFAFVFLVNLGVFLNKHYVRCLTGNLGRLKESLKLVEKTSKKFNSCLLVIHIFSSIRILVSRFCLFSGF